MSVKQKYNSNMNVIGKEKSSVQSQYQKPGNKLESIDFFDYETAVHPSKRNGTREQGATSHQLLISDSISLKESTRASRKSK